MPGPPTSPILRRVFCVALGVWGAWTLFAAAVAPAGASWARTLGLVAAAAVGIGVALLRPPPAWVVAAALALSGAVVVWGYAEWVTTGLAGAAMNGPFSMENPFAVLAATAAALALTAVCDADLMWPARVSAAVAAAVAGQAVVRSGSMGSLIALGCAAAVVLVGTWRRSRRVAALGEGVGVTLAIALAALGFGLAVSYLAAPSHDGGATSGLGVDPDNHATEHFEIWADAAQVFFDHPLLGVGPARLPAAVSDLEEARSDVVNALAETGLPAALAWSAAIVCAGLAVTVVLVRRCRPAVLALAAATTVLGTYSFVDTTAAWPLVTAVLWAVAGAVVAEGSAPAVVRAPSGRR